MANLDSIFEIKAAVIDLEKYLRSKDSIVSKKAQRKYERLVGRFFEENEEYLAPQQKVGCVRDMGYFLSLLESAIDQCYFEQ